MHPFVTALQKEDGTWHAGGQLTYQRRPEEETHHISTAWAALTLREVEVREDAVEQAQEPLKTWWSEEGESLEWLLVRLLLAEQQGLGDPAPLLAEVLASQNDDGGWSWLLGEDSDALATGQALYTLAQRTQTSEDGTEVREAAARGREYLLTTQEEDGTWPTRSTLKREEGPIPVSTYWGTGWAVVGLLEALPRIGGDGAPLNPEGVTQPSPG
jgi:squalene-hopene/tetraprenyl-beta-curcumene cyclase